MNSSRLTIIFLVLIVLLPVVIWLFNRPKTISPLGAGRGSMAAEGEGGGERIIFEEKLKPTREPTATQEPSLTPTPTKKPAPKAPTKTPALEPTIDTAPKEATESGSN